MGPEEPGRSYEGGREEAQGRHPYRGLIPSPSPLCPLLLPDIGSGSKGQVLYMRTSDPNDFSRMVKGLRELDSGEKGQRQALQWGLGGQAEKPKWAEIGGGGSWCHSTTAHKSFLFSSWVPERVHSGGASNECGQDWAPVLTGTVTSHQALGPSEEEKMPSQSPRNINSGYRARQIPGSV